MEIRFLNDIKKVLYDKKWARKAKSFAVYYIERGIKYKEDLRYDITIIPPKMLGKEFTKTKGHDHIGDFKEVYEVLKGKAIYLIQKRQKNKIKDVCAILAKKGDKVVIPPFYGHVTINPSKKFVLKMGNWISNKCKSDYKFFEKMEGACYYFTKTGWLKNKNYKQAPKLKLVTCNL